MARTGISITAKETILGASPDVNSNALLIVDGCEATNVEFKDAFELNTPYLIHSPDDLLRFGPNGTLCYEVYEQVRGFYNPAVGVSNVGKPLWVAGVETWDERALGVIIPKTWEEDFDNRPRILLIATTLPISNETVSYVQTNLEALWLEGFPMLAVFGMRASDPDPESVDHVSGFNAPYVSVMVSSREYGDYASVGVAGGCLASIPVSMSIGDMTRPPLLGEWYYSNDDDNTPARSMSKLDIEELESSQCLFVRSRPPKNGIWFNDGATATDSDSALSTLEAVRTLAAVVDDLRNFFLSYINTRVPVTSDGGIQPAYKQVVLDNAFSKVLTPYIENGDISDARLSLAAKDNDMVGTRTWEVSLSILPAPTLRWIDGFVFYVKNLS